MEKKVSIHENILIRVDAGSKNRKSDHLQKKLRRQHFPLGCLNNHGVGPQGV